MPDGGGGGGDDDDEPVMDENERIALQEQEDERMAREMFEREQGGSSSEVHVCVFACVCGGRSKGGVAYRECVCVFVRCVCV